MADRVRDIAKAKAAVRRALVERDRAGGALMSAQHRNDQALIALGRALARVEQLDG